MGYEKLRVAMVQEQLIPRGISDQRVLDAFLKVERHKFIPEELRGNAYADFPVPLGEKQTISQPYIVALMTESLGLTGKERVLEIGTGSGYQAAILAELAQEVYTIERFATLSQRSQELLLEELGYRNIKFKIGDGTAGWREEAPFERIIITAATLVIPTPLIEQLGQLGKMILPLGESFSQVLTLVNKNNDRLESKNICGCVFVPLVGKYSSTNQQ
jgi:protein-L-isoaspartate(D-aspartate) O-methyltransferase